MNATAAATGLSGELGATAILPEPNVNSGGSAAETTTGVASAATASEEGLPSEDAGSPGVDVAEPADADSGASEETAAPVLDAGGQAQVAAAESPGEGDAGPAASLATVLAVDDVGLGVISEGEVERFESPVPDVAAQTPPDAEDDGDTVLALLEDGEAADETPPAQRQRRSRNATQNVTQGLVVETTFVSRTLGSDGADRRLPGFGNL